MKQFYCPNFSLPQVKQEFTQLSNIVGEDYAYYLWNKNKGLPLDRIEEKGKETPNKEYQSLLNSFNGDIVKTTYSYVIQNSNAFRKQYPKYKDMNALDKAKAIHSYVNSSDTTIEDLAKRTIVKLPKGFTAEFYQANALGISKEGIVIDRKSIRNKLKQVQENTQSNDEIVDTPTGRQLLESVLFRRNNSVAKNVDVVNMQRVVSEGKFAEWTRDGIRLYQGSDYTDLYHESWHEFTQRYLTKAEKITLYSIVKSRPGTVTINDTPIAYSLITNRQAEEVLAEEFRQYALDRQANEKAEDLANIGNKDTEITVKNIFERIYDFFKNFFGKPANQLDIENPLATDAVMDMFIKLYEGKVNQYKPSSSNITENSINRSSNEMEIEYENVDNERLTVTLSALEVSEVFDAIDFWMAKEIEEMGVNFSFLLNPELKEKYLPRIYSNIKQKFEMYADQLDDQITEANKIGDETLEGILENRYTTISWVLSNSSLGDNWQKVIKKHQDQSKDGILKLNDPENKQSVLNNDRDQKEGDEYDETEATRNQENWDDVSVNPEQLASPTVLELLRKLPNLDNKGNLIYSSELGLPTVSDYKANKNLLFNRLNGIHEYSKVIEVLKNLAEYAPQLQFLVDQLPDSTKEVLTAEELSLKAQFLQSFTMSKVDPYSVKLQETSVDKNNIRLQPTTFLKNSLSTDTLFEYFDQDFKDNINRKFRIILNASETPRFDIIGAYNYYLSKGSGAINTDKDYFDFYREMFGVDLVQNRESIMFDKKGNYIKNSVPFLDGQRIDSIRNLAKHSFNKLTLIHKIHVESKNPNSPFVPKSLQAEINLIIESPFTYFATDIKKNLKNEILKLDDNSPIKKFFLEKFKQTTTVTERKYVFDTISFIYNTMESASYLNGENNLEWAIRERNHILSVKERINSAKTFDELPDQFNPEVNRFVQYSAWMSKLFGEDKKRKIAEDGTPINLEINNFADFTVGKQDGQKTTNLTEDDKFIQDLLAFMKDGVFENIRFGAKSSSFSSSIGNNKKERIYYSSDKFLDLTDNLVPSEVITQFQKYLRYELDRIFLSKEGRTPKEKLGANLLLFRGILEKGTIDQLETMAKNATSIEDLNKKFSAFYANPSTGFRVTFNNAIEKFFTKEVDIHKKLLARILTEGNVKDLGRQFANINNQDKPFTDDQLNKLMSYYLTNYMTHQFEFTNILVADVSNYRIKDKDFRENNFREAFKRFGLSSSPGKEPLLDDQDVRSRNQNPQLGRLVEAVFNDGARPYNKEYRVAIAKDIKSFDPTNSDSKESQEVKKILKEEYINNYAEYLAQREGKKKVTEKHKAQAEEEIGASVDTFLGQDEESNAQAYVTIDFIRFYLDSIGEWVPELESAYMHEVEVAKAIKQYRTTPTPENREIVERLRETANKGLLVSLKLGHYSEVSSKLDEVFNGKYSVLPLTPSVVFNTDNEERMMDMYKTGVDFVTFMSGAKMALPGQLFDYYKETPDGYELNSIPEESIFSLPIKGLRRQQYIAPKFKNKSTLSTQLVKLLFSNFYVDGNFNPELTGIKGLSEKINKAQSAFIKSLENIVENEKNRIYIAIGAQLDKDGNLSKIDYTKFEQWFKKEFDKKDISPSLYRYVTASKDGFTFSLDASPQRSVLESIISTVISKRVLRPDINGEAYIQAASTGFNPIRSRYKKLDKKTYKETLTKYGLTGFLQDYRIENGVTQPADVAISFNPKKHEGLLNLEFNGSVIGNLDKLNEILKGDTEIKKQWIEENSNKLTIVGVRIPVQGFNSMEFFRVKRFLPTVSGPIIVVPPSIVTKSGSDFDIDKLFMYEPVLDSNGNIIEEDLELLDKGETLSKMQKRAEAAKALKELKDILDPYKKIALNLTALPKLLKSEYLGVLKDIEEKVGKAEDLRYMDDFDTDIVQLSLKIKMLDAKIKRIYGEAYDNNPQLKPYIEDLNRAYNILAKYKQYSPNKIKATVTNNMVATFREVLSEPALFKFLIKPNDSNILRGIAGRYLSLKSVENKATSTTMYLPRISLAIYSENALGKKSLGIDAKTNALHKLYQQTGLRIVDSDLNDLYLVKSNKVNGQIILGGIKDANNENYISDIINEFINGHVDIEKEDWINYFNADKARTATILQMILNGTPIEDALILVNQPIIQNYISRTKRSKIKSALKIKIPKVEEFYTEILRPMGLKTVYVYGKFDEIATIKSILSNSSYREALINFNKGRSEILSEDEFTPEVNLIPDTFETILKNTTEGVDVDRAKANMEMYKQIALFTQYRLATIQNEKLLSLTSAIDFNTSKYRTINDFYSVNKNIEDAYDVFNKEAIDKIISNSVVSPFNVIKEAIALYQKTFDLVATPSVQDNINDFLDEYGKYWSSDKKGIEIANYINGLIHAIIQNKGSDGTTELFNKYGPSSDYLTKEYNPNKSLDLILNKIKSVEDPAVKNFINNNLLFKNLTSSEIADSGIKRTPLDGSKDEKVYNKFYFKVNTPDKDPDTIASIQKAWLDTYNFAGSTPEINNMINNFAFDLANATIYGQGFTIKYRSIQPFVPISLMYIDGSLTYIKELKKAFAEGNSEIINDFTENILFPFSKEYTIKYDRFRRKKYTPFKKYFPNYVSRENASPERTINVSAASKGFSAKLTNPTELAVYRKNLPEGKPLTKYEKKYKTILFYRGGRMISESTKENNALYPIVYKGRLYADVEAAYQANKGPYLISKTTQNLMKELITIKLSTYPELVTGIYSRGGEEYLSKLVHRVKGDKFWESDGEDMFIKTLTSAYKEVVKNVDVTNVSQTEPTPEEYNPSLADESYEGNYYPEDYEPELDSDVINAELDGSEETASRIPRKKKQSTYYQLPSTQVKEGVSELFESNSELASIGTEQQYSQYLDTIFPDSKVKDIVYHGSSQEIKDSFRDNFTEEGYSNGIFFTDSKSYLKELSRIKDTSKITSVIINAQDNKKIEEPLGYGVGQYWLFEQYDSIQGKDAGQTVEGNIYAVATKNQIHILGNNQDIEGFKKFVQSEESPLDIDIENCNIPS